MDPTNSSLESNTSIERPVENSTKNELVTTLGAVLPIAGFVFKVWIKILKISLGAAIWILKKIPTSQKPIEKS